MVTGIESWDELNPTPNHATESELITNELAKTSIN